MHDQLQGPEPETDDAVPALQRFVVGTDENDAPFEDPQTPFTGVGIPVGLKLAVAVLA